MKWGEGVDEETREVEFEDCNSKESSRKGRTREQEDALECEEVMAVNGGEGRLFNGAGARRSVRFGERKNFVNQGKKQTINTWRYEGTSRNQRHPNYQRKGRNEIGTEGI